MHNVALGSEEDFPDFMTKLLQDRHFAMDFWALTGTLSKREGGELSVEQMLEVIVGAVIGDTGKVGNDGNRTLVDELAALLAGVDLYSPSRFTDEDEQDDAVVLPPVASSAHYDSHTKFTDMAERAADEGRLAPSSPAPAAVPVPVASEVASEHVGSSSPLPIPTATSTATASHQFDETLMRLELNSIELKEHLEDLDKKMSRIVPHLEVLTSKISSTEHANSRIEEPLRDVEIPVRRSAEKPRLVLEPREEESVAGKRPVSTPFASYTQPRRRSNAAMVAMVILFALIVSGLLLQQTYGSSIWRRAGVTVRDKYDALLEKAHNTSAGQTAPKADESSPVATAANDESSPVNLPQSSGAVTPPTLTAGGGSDQSITEHAATSNDASQAANGKFNSRSGRGTMHSESGEAIEKTSVERVPAEEANAVNVAPSVMEANLVASRVPAYPEKAKENHIEGPVVMQAIISKDGFVDRVHVLEGNPRLRSAATEAVQKWRFKPYLLNGQPVEVATTITVDFKIDDW